MYVYTYIHICIYVYICHRLAYCATVSAATTEFPGMNSPLGCKEEARLLPLSYIIYMMSLLIYFAEIFYNICIADGLANTKICTHTRELACAHVHTHKHSPPTTHKHIHTHTHTHIHRHTRTHAYTHIHTHTHTLMHTFTHTYTRTCHTGLESRHVLQVPVDYLLDEMHPGGGRRI